MFARANKWTTGWSPWIYLLAVALIAGAIMPAALSLKGNWTLTAPEPPSAKVVQPNVPDLAKLPLHFELNAGQTDPAVRFMAHTAGGPLFFTRSGFTLSVPLPASSGAAATGKDNSASTVVTLRLLGANPNTTIETAEQLDGRVNYIVGNDPSSWHPNLPTYAGIVYGNIYPGIDLKYDGAGGKLKSTYIVAPGANPSTIQWDYQGATAKIDSAGNLTITSGNSQVDLTEQAPVAWQEIGNRRMSVPVHFNTTHDGRVGFSMGSYDPAYPLVIDPTLTFSTFLGGNNLDQSMGIAADASGNIYVVGRTWSTDFPTQNAYQPAPAGGHDVFVTKLQPNGTVVYSTYLGGTGDDEGTAIAVDGTGSVYVAGWTLSTNFPMHNAYQATRSASPSAFVSRLASDGQSLAYSTYFSGTAFTDAWAIATDGSNGAYIVGRTTSTNLPTRNAYQGTYGGTYDVYLARFNTVASGDASLVYSTYLGGSGVEYVGSTGYGLGDWGHGVAVDAAGNAYVAGQTASTNFPVRNAYQATLNGINDAFVTMVNTAAAGDASLVYSTYLGGSGQDAGKDVDIDAQGNAYVTGGAGTADFPTLNPYMPCVTGSAFVTKLNPSGNGLVYSTCFGAGGRGSSTDIAVDSAGSAYIVGTTTSANFPVFNAIQPALAGLSDAFVVKLTPAGNNVLYSTYLGGTSYEEGIGIAVFGTDTAYVTGDTRSSDFPVHNPIQGTCASCPSASDAFISTINEPQPAPTSTPTSTTAPPTPTHTSTPVPTSTNTPIASPTPTFTPVPSNTPTSRPTNTPVPGNNPPVITVPLNRPYRVGVEIGNYLALRFDASDPDVGDTVTFSVQNLPSGASLPIPTPGNPIYSTFTWSPTAPDIGTYYVTVIATDNHGAQDVAVVQIDVVPGCVPYFTDVFPAQYFYPAVQYLFCHRIVSGYLEADQTVTYRPYNNTSRGQFAKMVAGAYQLPPYNPETPDFTDVLPGSTFYSYIEAAFHAGIITGYGDRTFRPGAQISRGQLCKMVVRAAGWAVDTSGGPHFSDAEPNSTFYDYVETAYKHGVITGYACGGSGEPCDPLNSPYFRPGNPATRGQIAKILWLALGSPAPR